MLAALDHRETDRVPVDLGSTIVTTATRVAYQGLPGYLGLPPDDSSAIGTELCFWGRGIDVQQVLPYATHEEIEREVRYSVETLGRDGGHVFCAAHYIQPDVSSDRIDVMYRTALGHQPAGRAS